MTNKTLILTVFCFNIPLIYHYTHSEVPESEKFNTVRMQKKKIKMKAKKLFG